VILSAFCLGLRAYCCFGVASAGFFFGSPSLFLAGQFFSSLFFRPLLALDDFAHSSVGSPFPPAGLNPVYALVLPLLVSFFGLSYQIRHQVLLSCSVWNRLSTQWPREQSAQSSLVLFLLSSQWSGQIPRFARILLLRSGDFPSPHHVASALLSLGFFVQLVSVSVATRSERLTLSPPGVRLVSSGAFGRPEITAIAQDPSCS
jgi:hypothetical protein